MNSTMLSMVDFVIFGSIVLSITVIAVAIVWIKDLKKMKRGEYGK